MADSLASKLDNVLERLHFLEMAIRNLKDRRGISITDVGDIDERLFKEIASYEMSTEELKKDFVMLIVDDAKKLAAACSNNPNILNRTTEELNKIEDILDFIEQHEYQDIEASRRLQDFVAGAKEDLDNIRKEMEYGVMTKQQERRKYDQAQETHRKGENFPG
ncbi:hypothetical protein HYX01_04405 [Candidatus Woesearchaeota archaeon]|nr:hypothetical protein [Candidatus Woesearchaeota archaeon]